MTMELLDYGDYPRIDAAGLADFYSLPDGRIRFVMFDWELIRGIWQRRIVGMITRTTDTLREDHARLWNHYEREGAPLH